MGQATYNIVITIVNMYIYNIADLYERICIRLCLQRRPSIVVIIVIERNSGHDKYW